jgi:5-methylcytosine-specific restriction endonuclease McrA
MMKLCRMCKQEKPHSAFWRRKDARDGLDSRCSDCARPIGKLASKNYRKKHPDKFKAYNAKRPKVQLSDDKRRLYRERKRQRYHEQIEKSREQGRVKSQRQRKYAREYMRKLRAADPDYYRDYNKAWRAANKDRVQASDARKHAKRRAAKGATVGRVTAAQWEDIQKKQGHRCWYCNRKPAKLTQDHVVPLASGGGHVAANIVAACAPCNSSKHKKSIDEFAAERGRLFF